MLVCALVFIVIFGLIKLNRQINKEETKSLEEPAPAEETYVNQNQSQSLTNTETPKKKEREINIDIPHPDKSSLISQLLFVDKMGPFTIRSIFPKLDREYALNHVVRGAYLEKLGADTLNLQRYLNMLPASDINDYFSNDIENHKIYEVFEVRGVSFGGRGYFLGSKRAVGEQVELRPEPTNPRDKNAIGIYYQNRLIGYVPKEKTHEYKEIIEDNYYAELVYFHDDGYTDALVALYECNEKKEINGRSLSQIRELQGYEIDKKYYTPKKDVATNAMICGKKIVILGDFEKYPDKNEIAELFYEAGADLDKTINGKIEYAMVGKNVSQAKIDRLRSLSIIMMDENNFEKFL